MLRRLGWKDGEGLGRGGSGDVESVAMKLEQKHAGSSSVKSGVGASTGVHIPPIEYGGGGGSSYAGEGKEYKNSILRAAKARYNQIVDKK
jgi:hypothetical protein